MNKELTITDILTPQEPTTPHEFRMGVIQIDRRIMAEMGVDMQGCTIQGEFADKGVFADLHKRLLLPESYTIYSLFIRFPYQYWEVVVESLDLPPVDQTSEPPTITPVYEYTYSAEPLDADRWHSHPLAVDGITHGYRLKEIRIGSETISA
jgi:hypothetical protein